MEEKIGPINDSKEREHYILKRCCSNCKHLRSKSPTWPFLCHWCLKKKKHLICDLNYDHGCKFFLPLFTPEERKKWSLRFKEIINKTYER